LKGLSTQKPLRLGRRLPGIALGVFAGIAAYWLSGRPGVVEESYAVRFLPLVSSALSRFSAHLPLAVAELVVLGLLLRYGVGALLVLRERRRGRMSRARALGGTALVLCSDAGLLVFLFYAAWGLAYFRPPLEERLGWAADQVATTDELVSLAEGEIAAANAAYLQLHGSDDLGRPTPVPPTLDVLDEALEEGYRRVAALLGEPKGVTRHYGRTKVLLTGPVLEFMGLSGFYFPFSGEACHGRELPGVHLPQVMAHEKAHQRGFAPEDEASFMATAVCILSREPLARYSGHLFAQLRLLQDLAARDPSRAQALAERRSPGVRRDVDAQREFWGRYERASAVMRSLHHMARGTARSINDAYLKTHKVEEGVGSYDACGLLLVGYLRRVGGVGWERKKAATSARAGTGGASVQDGGARQAPSPAATEGGR